MVETSICLNNSISVCILFLLDDCVDYLIGAGKLNFEILCREQLSLSMQINRQIFNLDADIETITY